MLDGVRRLVGGVVLSRRQVDGLRAGLAYAGAPISGLSGSVSLQAPARRVLAQSIQETTSAGQRAANDAAMASLPERERGASPLCLGLLPCALAPWCKSALVTYTPPKISVLPQVTGVPVANFHALTFYLDGQLEHQVHNQSTPGYKNEVVTEHCKGGRTYNQVTPVAGSATVQTSHVFQSVSDEVNKLYAQVSAQLVLPEAAIVTGTPSFKTTGLFNVFWDLLRLFFTGTIKTHVSIPTTVSYKWRGQSFQQTYTYDEDVVLPVRKVNWDWL